MNKVLFTKKGCEKCEFVKQNLPKNHQIEIFDIEEPEGLSLLSWLSLFSTAQISLPIYVEFEKQNNTLLPDIQKVLTGAINIKNYFTENNA